MLSLMFLHLMSKKMKDYPLGCLQLEHSAWWQQILKVQAGTRQQYRTEERQTDHQQAWFYWTSLLR